MKKPLLAVTAALCLIATPAPAQDWPAQPIHIIVSFGAGGGADIIGRILADAMQERLRKPASVQNKPGAGGTPAHAPVRHPAPPASPRRSTPPGASFAPLPREET